MSTRESLRCRPVRRAAFASDAHLRGGHGVERACAFVRHVVDDGADALFLLGDIFGAWLGRRSLRDRGVAPFLDALRAARAADVRVVLVHGNHDFMMGRELERALDVEVAGRELDVSLGGRRVRLSHGDEYCTLDVGYHRFHRVLRSAPARGAIAHMPDRVLHGLVVSLEGVVARATARKSPEVMDIVDDAVRRRLASGRDAAVCGHVHRARDAVLALDVSTGTAAGPAAVPAAEHGRLVVMADFETTGSHATWRDGALRLAELDPRWCLGRPMVVALDGPAGSGKTTISRRLAERLGFALLDSGALYRCVAARVLRDQLDPADGPTIGAAVAASTWRLRPDGRVVMDGEPMTDEEIRGPAVSRLVSPIAVHPEVRAALMDVQRGAGEGHPGLVAEGRDMASVVFPDADLAVYLGASPEVRARRRLAQNAGEGGSLEEVQRAIEERDARDSGREHAPLRRVDGAMLLDTSDLTPETVLDRLVEEATARLRKAVREARAARRRSV